MSWRKVWSREFTTEDEADVVYEAMMREATAADRNSALVIEPDRLDGLTVVLGINDSALEDYCSRVEASYTPVSSMTPCNCGHLHAAHHRHSEDAACVVSGCPCESFDRADWPPK